MPKAQAPARHISDRSGVRHLRGARDRGRHWHAVQQAAVGVKMAVDLTEARLWQSRSVRRGRRAARHGVQFCTPWSTGGDNAGGLVLTARGGIARITRVGDELWQGRLPVPASQSLIYLKGEQMSRRAGGHYEIPPRSATAWWRFAGAEGETIVWSRKSTVPAGESEQARFGLAIAAAVAGWRGADA